MHQRPDGSGREALATSLELQSHAAALDPQHQRRARRARRLRHARRWLAVLLVVAAIAATWRYAPLEQWWDSVQDAGTGEG